jgi:2-oxoglutarate ferredoxin oxidoreductase subunit gamma
MQHVRHMLTEIRIAGFGGQGVILAAAVIGKAAPFSGRLRHHDAELRTGSARRLVSAQVILSDRADSLSLRHPARHAGGDVAGGLHPLRPQLKPGGILIVEQELVHIDNVPTGIRVYGVPATRWPKNWAAKMVLNIVMVGFFGAVTGLLDRESLRQAVADSVPASLPGPEPPGLPSEE